jgi:dihydrofolate synthase/folylpolyglutamate synthase
MTVSALAGRLPVALGNVRQGLQRARIAGRLQVLPGEVPWILDVAHNAQSARALAESLGAFPCPGDLHAVLGILADKDAKAIAMPMVDRVARWHLGKPPGVRALPEPDLRHALSSLIPSSKLTDYPDIAQALDGAAAATRPGDCVLVFGSFRTVEAALRRRGDRS